jgi:hypothetical protein
MTGTGRRARASTTVAGGGGRRWTEIDPFGRPIVCGERGWVEHAASRPELVPHEAAIRGTVRDPDLLYFDPASTAATRRRGDPRADIVHYVGVGRGQGDQQGNAVCVVVKLLPDDMTGRVVGFVASMYLPNAPQSRLQLVWSRPSQ